MDLAWDQILSLVGAFLILIAYAMESLRPGKLHPVMFQILNALGSFGLFIPAVIHNQYGFIVLEGSWFAISLVALGRMGLKKMKS
ncbi:MAG: hypothetical protein EOP10_27650 [Proteobacteria bacterium]|nr:MAG: hypothetical protein EOP10_27650 [Pseudomonadota bacterium]